MLRCIPATIASCYIWCAISFVHLLTLLLTEESKPKPYNKDDNDGVKINIHNLKCIYAQDLPN